jgi:cardiolipin synthase
VNLTIPNLLSICRMALIPLFIIAVIEGQPKRALWIFAIAGITDALDGFIARFFHQQSALGRYLDPAADKLLLVSAYVLLCIPGLRPGILVPTWVTVLVIARDVLIVVLALVLHIAVGITKFPPTVLSKINTVLQIATVALVLLSAIRPELDLVTLGAIYLVAGFTVASGLDYIYRANQLASENHRVAS